MSQSRAGLATAAATWLPLFVGLTVLSGCDARPEREPAEPPQPALTSIPGSDSSTGATDTLATQADSPATGPERWEPLAVPSAATPDTYPLTVRNPHPVPLIVYADGGAGEVLLDTVPARDSARVNLLIAADSVTLRAVGPDGRAGSPERIALLPDTGARWEARY